ncbi:MAG TPA: hypothetical protein VMD30_12810, partial [Tepidisphaeraceae bacterium]|nr:hypothetical protein [Tepidisphaeraceae bacterium]
MALVLFQTRKVRDVLKAGPSIGIDLLCLAVILALSMAVLSFGREVNAPYTPSVHIDLHASSLPKYTMFSL